MKISRQSQLWEFTQRYAGIEIRYSFEEGRGDICLLVQALLRGLFVVTLLSLIGVFLLFAVLTPIWSLLMFGKMYFDSSVPGTFNLFGCVVYSFVGVAILHFFVTPKKYETPTIMRVASEYMRAKAERFCTRVTIE